ncbi:VanZ family protein [Paenibacillus sp. KN14-4R]|uniref:VanZ family protein n=1 Tax=Paenibacillus sp. KN14-4R TaxID=3445773 RepID=UPI003F9FC49E
MTFYRKYRVVIWLILTILWMGFIFYKSAEPYKEQDMRPTLAKYISEERLHTWLPKVEFYYDKDFITHKLPYDMLEFFIRKCGHLSEFALLAFLWIKVLRPLFKYRHTMFTLLLSAFLSVAYAASDEWHQSFVVGRTGHAIDVAVDAIGVAVVVLIYGLILGIKGRNNRKKAAIL